MTTGDWRARLAADGFAVLPGVLDADEAAEVLGE